jgi:signal transduction histidine kinase
VPDLVTIVFYVMMIVGLLRMPFVPASRYGTLRTAMDVVAGMASAAAVLWQLQGRVFDDGPAAPLIHAALLGAMLIALLRQSPYALDFRLATLLVSLVPVILLTRLSPGVGEPQSLVLWSVSATCLAMVSWQMRRPQVKQNLILARPAAWRLVLPYAPVAGLAAVFYQQVVDGADLSSSPLSWAALVVTAAIATRSWAATRENRRLIEIERDQILASISHQLRTPLTAVSGFSDVLDVNWSEVPDHDKREMIGIIAEESADLVEIVADMAALARSELDATNLRAERLEGKAVIADAIRRVFDVSGPIPVKAEVEPYLELIGDRRRLVQILKALLENAQRYGNGKILVVAKRDKAGRLIEVHDDGAGLSPRYAKIVWRRFERGEHELNAHVPGSGLGLAVVRALARAHGGEAFYRRSERLGGACFTVELPYTADSDVTRG